MKTVPKYRKVLEFLEGEIRAGKFRPGERLPSEAALVKQLGASRITIGRALGELRHRGLIFRRAGSGTYVSLPEETGLYFGLLIPNLGQTEIFEPICQGMADSAGEHALLWGPRESAGRGGDALKLCHQYVSKGVAGVFFAPLEHTLEDAAVNQSIVSALDAAGIPVVLLDRDYVAYPSRSPHDLIGIDNRRAGAMAAEHLLRAGSRRPAFWASPLSAATIEARIAGFREALIGHSLPANADFVGRGDPCDESLVGHFMQSRQPDGFVCGNDVTAGGLMRSLLSLGYRIPGDVRIVGIDDVRYAEMLPVPLTTVRQPCHDMGVAAMAAMLERVRTPKAAVRDILLACDLVVRDSSGLRNAPAAH